MAYSAEEIEIIFDKILERIEKGEALRTILKDKYMPSSRTFFKWLDEDSVKVKQYAYSCEQRADAIFDEMIEIADEAPEKYDTEFSKRVDGGYVQNKRVRIDARKWMLSKMNPKKYSDKIQVDNSEFTEQPLFPEIKKK